jgi:hypothetical protein
MHLWRYLFLTVGPGVSGLLDEHSTRNFLARHCDIRIVQEWIALFFGIRWTWWGEADSPRQIGRGCSPTTKFHLEIRGKLGYQQVLRQFIPIVLSIPWTV